MGLRAQRKKAAKKFKVGDLVTWGRCTHNAKVVEVAAEGVYVDTELEDGRRARHYFVSYLPNQSYGYLGTAVHVVKAR